MLGLNGSAAPVRKHLRPLLNNLRFWQIRGFADHGIVMEA